MDARENFSERGKLSTIEKRFVAQVLSSEGNKIWDEQTRAIDKYGLYREGIMRNQRGYRLKGDSSFYNGNLEVYFVKYLRFHDMRKDKMVKPAVSILGVEKATKERRRQYHLYNRIVFGRMNSISARLMWGLTEDVKQQLAQEYNIPI